MCYRGYDFFYLLFIDDTFWYPVFFLFLEPGNLPPGPLCAACLAAKAASIFSWFFFAPIAFPSAKAFTLP